MFTLKRAAALEYARICAIPSVRPADLIPSAMILTAALWITATKRGRRPQLENVSIMSIVQETKYATATVAYVRRAGLRIHMPAGATLRIRAS